MRTDDRPPAIPERSDHVDDIGSCARDLLSLVSENEHSEFSTPYLRISGLAQELAGHGDTDSAWRTRAGEPLISWPELVAMSRSGAGRDRVPEWALGAFEQLVSIVRKPDFPCIFARGVTMMRSGWACFVDTVTEETDREIVRRAILAYLDALGRFPEQKAILMPLSVIVKPVYPALSIAEYSEQAWDLFQYLHDHDEVPWPDNVPTDPNSGSWSFCFAGRQLFSNVSHPAHKVHTSRCLGDSLAFAMQPRTNFDVVAGNTPKGHVIRNKIRKRAEAFEGRPAAKTLGYYGSDENREWKQMVTQDHDEPYPETCPLRIRRRPDESRRMVAPESSV